jgi:hypothetical protein
MSLGNRAEQRGGTREEEPERNQGKECSKRHGSRGFSGNKEKVEA